MLAMYSEITKNITFKYNYDNFQETIDYYKNDLIKTQEALINLFIRLDNGKALKIERVKTSISRLKFRVKELNKVIEEIEDIEFINKLNNNKAKYFYLVDFEDFQNKNKKKERKIRTTYHYEV